jgi:hypothetical protein
MKILYVLQCKQHPNLPATQIPKEDYIYINCDAVLPCRKLKTLCTDLRSVNKHQQWHPHQLWHWFPVHQNPHIQHQKHRQHINAVLLPDLTTLTQNSFNTTTFTCQAVLLKAEGPATETSLFKPLVDKLKTTHRNEAISNSLMKQIRWHRNVTYLRSADMDLPTKEAA